MEVGKEQATEITDYYQREVHVSVEEASFTSGQVGERKLMELRLVCFFFRVRVILAAQTGLQ